jgi:hypothetical protein
MDLLVVLLVTVHVVLVLVTVFVVVVLVLVLVTVFVVVMLVLVTVFVVVVLVLVLVTVFVVVLVTVFVVVVFVLVTVSIVVVALFLFRDEGQHGLVVVGHSLYGAVKAFSDDHDQLRIFDQRTMSGRGSIAVGILPLARQGGNLHMVATDLAYPVSGNAEGGHDRDRLCGVKCSK